MKYLANRTVIAIVVFTMASALAFAKGQRDKVNFPTNIKINGTLVKQGTYDAVFNEQTSELSIMKGDKVVAKTNVRVEKRDGKASQTEYRSLGTGDDNQLVSIAFGGSNKSLVVSQGNGQAAAND